jgi:hypothetical protein
VATSLLLLVASNICFKTSQETFMAPDICSIVLAVSLGSFPGAPTSPLKDAWFISLIRNHNTGPLREELVRNEENQSPIPQEFVNRTTKAFGVKDCSAEMASAGLKFGSPQEAEKRYDAWVSPDGRPTIEFQSVFLSQNANYSLVTWSKHRAQLDYASHFAVLKLEKKHWRVIRDGRFGPIS